MQEVLNPQGTKGGKQAAFPQGTGSTIGYQELVNRLAQGQQIDQAQRDQILSAEGKSLADLQADVQRRQRR